MDKKEIIFNMYKDNVIVSKKFKDEMKEKYNLNVREADDLFVKINNYQIKKYGGRLEFNNSELTKEEMIYQNKLAKQRVNSRKYR
jgi:hypothetical protein